MNGLEVEESSLSDRVYVVSVYGVFLTCVCNALALEY